MSFSPVPPSAWIRAKTSNRASFRAFSSRPVAVGRLDARACNSLFLCPFTNKLCYTAGSMNTGCAKMPKWFYQVFTRGWSTCANCAKITFGTDTLLPVPQCHILIGYGTVARHRCVSRSSRQRVCADGNVPGRQGNLHRNLVKQWNSPESPTAKLPPNYRQGGSTANRHGLICISPWRGGDGEEPTAIQDYNQPSPCR